MHFWGFIFLQQFRSQNTAWMCSHRQLVTGTRWTCGGRFTGTFFPLQLSPAKASPVTIRLWIDFDSIAAR